MATFVEFEAVGLKQSVWINPDWVIRFESANDDDTRTHIQLHGGTVVVNGSAVTVGKLLMGEKPSTYDIGKI